MYCSLISLGHAMQYRFYIILFAFFLSITNTWAQSDNLILSRNGESIVFNMPKEMSAAIQKSVPGFRHWNFNDYLPRVKIEFKGNESPFVVIGDFNHDGVADAILDGADTNRSLVIAVVSNKQTYRIQILEEYDRVEPESIKDVENGKIETGFNRFLVFNPKKKKDDPSYIFDLYYMQIETPDGGLSDPAIITYSFKDGKVVVSDEFDG